MITISNKSKQFLWLVFKLSIVILLGFFIYDRLMNQDELSWNSFSIALSNSSLVSFSSILILLVLTIINWFLEIYKWKLLASQVKSLSFKDALIQSLSSLSFSLLTPNRIGEYGAKALYYEKKDRKKVILLNFIGNFHQLLATLILGFIGVFFNDTFTEYEFSKPVQIFIRILSIAGPVTVIILNSIKKYKDWRKSLWKRLDYITKKLNFQIFGLSLLRYIVFSHQFYFLIWIFNLNISYEASMAAITTVYLFASIIPMLSLFDFVLKGSMAVVVFSTFGFPSSVILSITTLMWILNFVFPSILGSYYVLTFQPMNRK